MRCIASQSIVPASAEKTPHTPSAKVAGAQPLLWKTNGSATIPGPMMLLIMSTSEPSVPIVFAPPTDWTRARIGRESEAPSPSSPSMPLLEGVSGPELGAEAMRRSCRSTSQ